MNRQPLTFFATRWGPQLGGPNALNQDLCISLARVLSLHEVTCVVLSATEVEISMAAASNVQLLSLDRPKDEEFPEDTDEIASRLQRAGVSPSQSDWVVGHDIKSGFIARAVAERFRCRAAAIMHMSYGDYSHVKAGGNAARQKEEAQRTLFTDVEGAFAVGPLLLQRLEDLRPQLRQSTWQMIPGLPEPLEIISDKRICAVAYGRLEVGESLIKQAPLVVAGFGSAVARGIDESIESLRDARLKLIGVPDNEQASVRRLAEKHAKRLLNLELIDFISDREALKEHLGQCNLALMLSWHEGFGLAAWEAIGLGIPLVLSKNSGVYRLLDAVGGRATGSTLAVDVKATASGQPAKQDIEEISRLLLRFSQRLPKHCEDARLLSSMLRTQFGYTWQSCALRFAEALGLSVKQVETIGATSLDRTLLNDRNDLQAVSIRNWLRFAELLTDQGEYEQALKKIAQVEAVGVSEHHEYYLPLLLRKANCLLRLNRYSDAETLARIAIRHAIAAHPSEHIDGLGILNVLHRDRGKYSEAVATAREMLKIAEERCPEKLGQVRRKLARSLALAGDWSEAVRLAKAAADQAPPGSADQAKALLALGEAYRHGLDQEQAISSYVSARDTAATSANTDCWLWANLGLSDSLFIIDDLGACLTVLQTLGAYISTSQQAHPLESLHLELSLIAIEIVRSDVDEKRLRKLIEDYGKFGISWPGEYVAQLRAGQTRVPRTL